MCAPCILELAVLVFSAPCAGAAPYQRPGVSNENGIGTVETADPRPRVIVKGDDVQAGVTQFQPVPVRQPDLHKADDAQETTPTRDQQDDVLPARTDDVTIADVISVAPEHPEGNTGLDANDPWRFVVVATSSVLLALWLLGGLVYCACCRKSMTYPWYLRHKGWAFSPLYSSDSPAKMPMVV